MPSPKTLKQRGKKIRKFALGQQKREEKRQNSGEVVVGAAAEGYCVEFAASLTSFF